jgi:hypothetical protein
MFSAIVGRFLTAFTAWRLERGMEVAAVEYITGSRTVFGAISTPFRLRLLHNTLPLLLILWVLSPLGGQASLRVVFLTDLTEEVRVYYLDSLTQMFSGTVSIYEDTIKAVFISALLAPVSTKEGYRDLFGNLKVPLLEEYNAGPQFADGEGWYTTETEQTPAYSSLIGLPIMGLPAEGTTALNIETSYMYSDCLLTQRDDDTSGLNYTSCHNGLYKGMTLALDADPEFNASDPSTAPRKIWFGSMAGALTAECSLTTTYVEIRHLCNGNSCAPAAIRRSKLPHKPATTTWLDGLSSNEWRLPVPIFFCSGFINATDMGTISPYRRSVLERYLANPDTAFSDVEGSTAPLADLANLSNHIFSRRFTQVMNTYWLAATAPVSVSGNFTIPYPGYGHGFVSNTTSEWRTTKDVLDYDTTWLVVLMVSSLVMLAAGIATVVLNLMRRGPEVLDSFTSMLRDNPYVHENTGASTEDASEKVRRLRKTRVMLGDVHPLEMTGHVAVTTGTDEDSVQPLRSGRHYY